MTPQGSRNRLLRRPLGTWPFVQLLLLVSRPSAVLWAIVPIIVYSFHSHSRWSLSHVCDEIRKRIEPSIAHFYSSSPVVSESSIPGIVASAFNSQPHIVNLSSCPSMSFVYPWKFRVPASATGSKSQPDRVELNQLFVSAVAFEPPTPPGSLIFSDSHANQSPVSFTGNV